MASGRMRNKFLWEIHQQSVGSDDSKAKSSTNIEQRSQIVQERDRLKAQENRFKKEAQTTRSALKAEREKLSKNRSEFEYVRRRTLKQIEEQRNELEAERIRFRKEAQETRSALESERAQFERQRVDLEQKEAASKILAAKHEDMNKQVKKLKIQNRELKQLADEAEYTMKQHLVSTVKRERMKAQNRMLHHELDNWKQSKVGPGIRVQENIMKMFANTSWSDDRANGEIKSAEDSLLASLPRTS